MRSRARLRDVLLGSAKPLSLSLSLFLSLYKAVIVLGSRVGLSATIVSLRLPGTGADSTPLQPLVPFLFENFELF